MENGGALTVHNGHDYTQTGGVTTVNTGGTLTAANVVIQGGRLSGFGTVAGNLVNDSVVSPGDPGTLNVTGNYTQHLLGMLEEFHSQRELSRREFDRDFADERPPGRRVQAHIPPV